MGFARWPALAAAALLTLALTAAAQEDDGSPAPAASVSDTPYSVTRDAAIEIGGETLDYEVTAGEIFLRAEDGTPRAAIFSISYVKAGEDDPTTRPVTFVFNGGPGSASLWLHMGAWGPKRVITPPDASDAGAPPYPIEDNPHSLLDVSDLVFIDPVGTGYSRALGATEATEFYGVNEDAESIAEFIRIWITREGRWNSPKYLAGESYGTTRAAAVAEKMQGGWNGIALNGVILVSAILDFQTARFAPGNDTPHVAFFPTMAATAWYHDRVDRDRWDGDFDAFIEDARSFATHVLPPALIRGESMSAEEMRATAEQMAGYLGVGADWIEDAKLRVGASRFRKELLRDADLIVGRFDSRYTGVDSEHTGDTPENDPSGYGMDVAYTAAVNDYLTRELGVEYREGNDAEGALLDRRYKVLTGEPGRHWNWSQDERGWPAYVNVAPWLGKAMRENADFRVLLASGWYDLATPFFGAEMSLFKNGMVLDRVDFTYYEAGHMMYLVEQEAEDLSDDTRAFISGEKPG